MTVMTTKRKRVVLIRLICYLSSLQLIWQTPVNHAGPVCNNNCCIFCSSSVWHAITESLCLLLVSLFLIFICLCNIFNEYFQPINKVANIKLQKFELFLLTIVRCFVQDQSKEVGPLSVFALTSNDEVREDTQAQSKPDSHPKETRMNGFKDYNQMKQMKADRSAAMTSPFGQSSPAALHSVEVVTAAGMDRMLSLLLDVSRNLAGLRDITHSLKLQGQTMHKMLKRLEAKQASSSSSVQPPPASASRQMNVVEIPEPNDLPNTFLVQKGIRLIVLNFSYARSKTIFLSHDYSDNCTPPP